MRGGSSVHLEESEVALRQTFNRWWKRSTIPLAYGLYAVVRIRLVTRRFVMTVKRGDSNCVTAVRCDSGWDTKGRYLLSDKSASDSFSSNIRSGNGVLPSVWYSDQHR